MRNKGNRNSKGLTTYGVQVLKSFYRRHKIDAEFENEEAFIDYAIERKFKDFYSVELIEPTQPLTRSNVEFKINISHVRATQLGLYKAKDERTYGDKVNLIKEIGACFNDIESYYRTITYYIDNADVNNKADTLDIIRLYLRNELQNLTQMRELLDKIDIEGSGGSVK